MYIENKHLFEELDNQYNQYLDQHIGNVQRGYDWLKENLPEVLSEDNYVHETSYYGELDEIIEQHDKSKYNKVPDAENYYDLACEWDAYNDYFYGEKTPEVESAFNKAWLAHIHANPHHWQHWLLQHDDEGLECLDMPYVFIIEMICDHWSFSWKSDNLYEIFKWYDDHKEGIQFSDKTRKTYESILDKIKEKLDEV
ncbi:MAG: hypothetical protein J6R47_01360 [Acholeplasmatales bacterium]|nr:hypothetical protein [Acholeplasmatales bacterium]